MFKVSRAVIGAIFVSSSTNVFAEINFNSTGQNLGTKQSLGVTLKDFDNDGDIDAFVANAGVNRVWLNNGLGQFNDSGLKLGNFSTSDLIAGDFDDDGDIDVATSNDDDEPNRIWLNDGIGGFTDSGQALGIRTSLSVVTGDFDGDGDLDLMEGSRSGTFIWWNDGFGGFSDSGQRLGELVTRDIAVADIDNDGDLDAILGNGDFSGDIELENTIFINDGSGIFTQSNQSLGMGITNSVALGDLDGDGDLDLVITTEVRQENTIWINDGLGSYEIHQVINTLDYHDINLADFDNDGDLDIHLANWNGGNHIWENNGLGEFSDSGLVLGGSPSFSSAVADLNGDNKIDIFVGNKERNIVWLNAEGDVVTTPAVSSNGGGAFSVWAFFLLLSVIAFVRILTISRTQL